MNIIEMPLGRRRVLKKRDDGKLELPFSEDVHNHLQTIHAGAQFALAETSSGEILQTIFPELANKVIPVLRDSQIKYKRPANTKVLAYPSVSNESISKFTEQFSRKGRGFISVAVEVKDTKGIVTCTGTFKWFIQKL